MRVVTLCLIALTAALFLTDSLVTPLQSKLLFDYPKSREVIDQLVETYDLKTLEDVKKMPKEAQRRFFLASDIPSWRGLAPVVQEKIRTGSFPEPAAFCEKIQEGEVWRLLTPAFLHHDFLHLFFNLGWLWLLGLQIERRLLKSQYLLLIAFLALFSNCAQYLISGPFFLGLSGVVAGLGAFIWSRQKYFPEERYPLKRQTALFMAYFILAMAILGAVAFTLQTFFALKVSFPIANTAHLSGALLGFFLGKTSFFQAKRLHKVLLR